MTLTMRQLTPQITVHREAPWLFRKYYKFWFIRYIVKLFICKETISLLKRCVPSACLLYLGRSLDSEVGLLSERSVCLIHGIVERQTPPPPRL